MMAMPGSIVYGIGSFESSSFSSSHDLPPRLRSDQPRFGRARKRPPSSWISGRAMRQRACLSCRKKRISPEGVILGSRPGLERRQRHVFGPSRRSTVRNCSLASAPVVIVSRPNGVGRVKPRACGVHSVEPVSVEASETVLPEWRTENPRSETSTTKSRAGLLTSRPPACGGPRAFVRKAGADEASPGAVGPVSSDPATNTRTAARASPATRPEPSTRRTTAAPPANAGGSELGRSSVRLAMLCSIRRPWATSRSHIVAERTRIF